MTNGPIGTRDQRVTRAIHLKYTTDLSTDEIGEKLGVSGSKVRKYLNEPPAQEVEEFLSEKQAEVREMAVAEYTKQLREADKAAREAEEPTEVWRDEDGEVQTVEVRDGHGNLLERNAVPQSYEMDADTTEQYFRREEKREILESMRLLVGADAPDKSEIEHSGEVDGFNFTINASNDNNDND